MKFALFALAALMITFTSSAQASEAAATAEVKKPIMQCMYLATFLTSEGAQMSDLIDLDIPLEKDASGVFRGNKVVDLGHGVSLSFSGKFSKVSSVKNERLLVQRSRLVHTDSAGRKTVVVSGKTDSEESPLDPKIPSTSITLENPAVENAQINNGNISALEVMKRGLLPEYTISSSFTSCLLRLQ